MESPNVLQKVASLESPGSADEVVLSFGDFHLRPRSRILAKGQERVSLGARAFDILLALVERAGVVVPYDDLIARAWPETNVEEANLRVQISGLRRALARHGAAQRFILNVANRGYVFSAPVITSRPLPIAPAGPRRPIGNLPSLVGSVFGRDNVLADIQQKFQSGRLVTVVGPGGIGKTTVALGAAEQIPVDFAWFIDLQALGDGKLLPITIARTLGINSRANNALSKIHAFLLGKKSLIIFDNCEHLTGASAEMAMSLLSSSPSLKLLVTSRQPLRLSGERVCRLSGLAAPSERSATAVEALSYPAAQLFVERARAHTGSFDIGDLNAPLVGEVCRRLDGIPLALEFAAGAVGAIGLRELARGLVVHFDDLDLGRRTTRSRHMTLRATLDWSYGLLTEPERALLARLSVFTGAFSLESAIAVGAGATDNLRDVIASLAELTDKSLVVADTTSDPVFYSLLQTTRAYAKEKLAALPQRKEIARRFARHVGEAFRNARREWTARNSSQWAERMRRWLGDVRQAVEWSKSDEGDVDEGAALLIESSQLWFDLGLLSEFLDHVLEVRGASSIDPSLHMRLSAIAGNSVFMLESSPPIAAKMHEALKSALQRALATGDKEYQFNILLSQSRACAWTGEYDQMPEIARQMLAVGRAIGRPDADTYYALHMGAAEQRMGNLTSAATYIAQAYHDLTIDLARSDQNEVAVNSQIFNKCIDARLRWIRGYADQSIDLLREVTESILTGGHVPSYGHVLRTVVLVAVGVGDKEFIDGPLEKFLRYGEYRNLDYHDVWRAYVSWGVRSREESWNFEKAREIFATANFELGHFTREMFVTLHPGFRLPGMLESVRAGKCGWCAPEVIRSHGVELESRGNHGAAETAFNEAIERARGQGALLWELRATRNLCVSLSKRGQHENARVLLNTIYKRFTEGHTSADLRFAAEQIGAQKN